MEKTCLTCGEKFESTEKNVLCCEDCYNASNTLNTLLGKWVHKKTGNIYWALNDTIINTTNINNDQKMILYFKDNLYFVREEQEFKEKFERVSFDYKKEI